MLRAPRTETIILAPGTDGKLDVPGRYLTIRSCSVASFEFAFENESWVLGFRRVTYPSVEEFAYVRFRDRLGGGCTIVVTIADVLGVEAASDVLDSIDGHLEQIDQEISGAAADPVTGQLADTVCPITPGPGVALFAANSNRTEIEISSPSKNGAGLVYLGITAARANAVDNFKVLQAGESWWSEREKQAIFASSSTGAEVVNGREC